MINTIHHFEDEPELLHWLPSTLLNRYWSEHPDWISDQGGFSENAGELLTTFSLNPASGIHTVRYRVYRTKSEFEERFPDFAAAGDVVLLDVMAEEPKDRRLIPVGLDLRKVAIEVVGADRVFLLTAFPHSTMSDYDVPEEAIIPKPPDVDSLLDLLVDKLSIE